MKKLFLLLGAGLTAYASNAQSIMLHNGGRVVNTPADEIRVTSMPARPSSAVSNPLAKTTGPGGSRWYSHYEAVDALNAGALNNNSYLVYIWFDSTVKQRFNTGLGTINFSSLNEYINPWAFDTYNDKSLYTNNEIKVTSTDAYTVDSIAFSGAYIKNPARPTSIVDTLILSVAPSNGRYALRTSQYAWIANYLPAGKDTLYAYTVLNVDSVNRAAFPDATSQSRQVWKVALTDAMRTPLNSSGGFDSVKYYKYKLPTALTIPAGYGMNVTVTFKSGDTWTKNVDSVNKFHRFMPISGEGAGSGTKMPYYYYDQKDRNMSGLMFSTDTSFYEPSIMIEGFNAISFRQEFHDIMAHVVCATCNHLAIGDVNTNNIAAANAYPNPAVNQVSIPFSMNAAGNVNVSILNIVGQTLKTQDMGNVKAGESKTAIFNTSDLANGIYLFSVESNGQRVNGRVVVAH